ncbi:MAG: phage holin family protein, partial [Gaiellaceae bacterium]
APTGGATRTPANGARPTGVGGAAKQVADHAKALVGLEVELAGLELKRKLGALGIGIGLVAVAAVLAVYMLGFLLATLAAALATFLATWLALLIVSLFLLALAALLGVVGLGRIKRGTPPVPEQAIREAKLTTEALKANGDR